MDNSEDTPRKNSDRGATATEYAVLCGFIAFVIVFGVAAFGTALGDYYNHLVAGVQATLRVL